MPRLDGYAVLRHLKDNKLNCRTVVLSNISDEGEQAKCARCQREFASLLMVKDLITVERGLGFRYEMKRDAPHYQHVCPACRRALFGLAQGALWRAPRSPGLRPTLPKDG